MFGKNVDKTEVEVGAKVQNFLATTFQKFHCNLVMFES
jgi:hypothetical protein